MAVATASAEAGRKHRETMAARSRAQSLAAADIGPPPKRDAKLYRRYKKNLLRFLVECFPHSTGLKPFSEDHKRIIRGIQDTILNGGKDLNIVYRGFAKSTIAENALIWAAGYGYRHYVYSIGADSDASSTAINSIKRELETNEHLMAVFPEACHCVRALDGAPQRSARQRIGEHRTHILYKDEEIHFPMVKGFAGSGCIIRCKGITANIRGARYKRVDGVQVRPDLVLIDDPQTDETAANPNSNTKLLRKISSTIERLSGHFDDMAIVMNATVIEPDDAIDQLRDRELYPSWRINEAPMLKTLPENKQVWLEDYAEILTDYTAGDKQGKRDAQQRAMAFYQDRRKVMDAGAEATWRHCFNERTECSAIEHAMRIWIETNEESFLAECQNTPCRPNAGLDLSDPATVQRKTSGVARGVVPSRCETITGFIDVHPGILYWHKWAWRSDDEAGFMFDRGTTPDQQSRYFAHGSLRRSLADAYPDHDVEAALVASLDGLINKMFETEHQSESGTPQWMSHLGIDANGEFCHLIMDVVRRSKHAGKIIPTFGAAVLATQKPISRTRGQRGRRAGEEWIPVREKPGQPLALRFDANHWKTKFHRRLALPMGSRGALHLYEDDPRGLRMPADHFFAEYPKRTESEGRTVYQWRARPGADNHEFDCGVGSMVIASYAGVFGGVERKRSARRGTWAQRQQSRRSR